MIYDFPFHLGIYATSRISDMGPLELVLNVLVFFCALCFKLRGLCSFKTLDLAHFGLESHEATIFFPYEP